MVMIKNSRKMFLDYNFVSLSASASFDIIVPTGVGQEISIPHGHFTYQPRCNEEKTAQWGGGADATPCRQGAGHTPTHSLPFKLLIPIRLLEYCNQWRGIT